MVVVTQGLANLQLVSFVLSLIL